MVGLYRSASAGKYFKSHIENKFPHSSADHVFQSLPVVPASKKIASTESVGGRYYSIKDKPTFSTTLVAFEAYRSYILKYCSLNTDINDFNHFLKDDKQFNNLKVNARLELQNIYIAVALEIGLPKLSVFLPTRKKVSVMGIAKTISGTPQEIRIYTIHGPSHKNYSFWRGSDMILDDASNTCETLVHEIAHIYEAHFHRILGHDDTFIEGYLAVERVLLKFGFQSLLLTQNRFTGCPPASKAFALSGTSPQF